MLKTLEDLILLVRERKNSTPEDSYTKKLLNSKSLSVEKVKEEIKELFEAVENNSNKIHEAADVLYHLIVYLEINEAQKTIIKNQIILIHEGMVSEKDVFKKAKLFDKKGVFGIGKTEMTKKEFESFLEKESLHFGY